MVTNSLEGLKSTLAQLTARGKGILAADERPDTIKKRFEAVNAECTDETRREYRELLFSTPGLGAFISGAILSEDTLGQYSARGQSMTQVLAANDILTGIKVDGGIVPMPGFLGEGATQGLDGLALRLAEFRRSGARFAKWRAVFTIGPDIPTASAITANAHALARYVAACQEQGLVPIVEPEVLMDGDHSLASCARVTELVQHAVFHALREQRVALEYVLLKPNMITPGLACSEHVTPAQIAEATITCLRRTVPAAVPAIHFLSGGQSEVKATANLNAINAIVATQPWFLSFSYGRALQMSALAAWRGQSANVTVAQAALYQRAQLNSAAVHGTYTPAMEPGAHATAFTGE